MERYGAITGASFGDTVLSGPVSVSVKRHAEPAAMGGDSDEFVTSVQLSHPAIKIVVRIGDTAVADVLSLGQIDVLSIEIAPTRSGQAGREITVSGAVLIGIDLQYEQSAPSTAELTFRAEAADGDTDPFSAQETQA